MLYEAQEIVHDHYMNENYIPFRSITFDVTQAQGLALRFHGAKGDVICEVHHVITGDELIVNGRVPIDLEQ